jgi:DNA-binding PadR family transcriptional regulator
VAEGQKDDMRHFDYFRHAFREHMMERAYCMSGPGGRFGMRSRGGFMGRAGFDGEGFRSGRKLGGGDLQLLLLALLAEKPAHGYELIKTLEERSGGFYSPSPGMIYPALTYLDEIGHASVEAEGTKKLYRVTEEGKAHLDKNRGTVEAIFGQLERIRARMGDYRRATGGDNPDDDFGTDDFKQARRALRQALRDRRQASPDELRRIADILNRAAAEIAGKAD